MSHFAILVIDLLNDFLSGALRCDRAAEALPETARLLDGARAAGVPVIFCCDAHRREDPELAVWGEHALEGSAGAEIAAGLCSDKDSVVRKRAYSAFFGTDLDRILREAGADAVVLVGIQAHICVQHTAADAFFRGYRVVLADGLVEAFTEGQREEAIRYMHEMYAAERIGVDELLACFRG